MKKQRISTSTSSEDPAQELAGESQGRAAAADEAGKVFEFSPSDESRETAGETTFEIDPAKMHGLLKEMLRGLVLRVDGAMGWKQHPDDTWCDATTTALEIILEKWLGTIGTSPEALFLFNVSFVWILPNVLAGMEKKTPVNGAAAGAPAGTAASPA